MRSTDLALALAALAALAEPVPCAAAQACFQGLGMLPGAEQSQVHGLSADGATVVGDSGGQAFRWTAAGGLEGLAFLPGDSTSSALAVSHDGGVVVGWSGDASLQVAVRWTSSGAEALAAPELTPPEASFGDPDLVAATSVSADGSRVIGYGLWLEAYIPLPIRAVVWDAGIPFDPTRGAASDVSADGVVVVGDSFDLPDDSMPWLWTEAGGLVLLPELSGETCQCGSYVRAVSADGTSVVGVSHTEEPFRWTAVEGVTALPVPPGEWDTATAYDVSADGSVVVGNAEFLDLVSFEEKQAAFLWDAAHGTRLLGPLLEAFGVDLSGWQLERATAISEDGLTLAGTGTNPDGDLEAWLATLPSLEPPAPVPALAPTAGGLLALLLAGAGAAGVARQRRR